MSTAAEEPRAQQDAPEAEWERRRELFSRDVPYEAPLEVPMVAHVDVVEQRRTISHVDLLSVLKVSIAFYFATVLVGVVAFLSLWLIAQSAGIVENLEDFIADLLVYDEFDFLSFEMLRAIGIIGVVWIALATTLTMIAAAFYNLFADLVGGVEIVLEEEPGDTS